MSKKIYFEDSSEIRFDDSSIANFFIAKNNAVLEVEDVRCKGSLVKISITVEGYTSLQTEDENNEFVTIGALEKIGQEGEVVAFHADSDDSGYTVLIEWQWYQPRRTEIRNYKVRGKSMTVDVGTPYPDKRSL